jgi:S1-C subfamily serine protease
LTDASSRLTASLADRYRIERELGQGGMATVSAAESRGSADVAEATLAIGLPAALPRRCTPGRFSDLRRAVASATSSGHGLENHDA